MKTSHQKAANVLGISFVAAIALSSVSAHSSSLGDINGYIGFTGPFELYNSAGTALTQQYGLPSGDVTKVPVSAGFADPVFVDGPSTSSTGTFADNGFTNSVPGSGTVIPMTFQNLQFLDKSTTSNILNQVVIQPSAGNPTQPFVSFSYQGASFTFDLTSLAVNDYANNGYITTGSDWVDSTQTTPLFTINGTGVLKGFNANGTYNDTPATFFLSSTQQDANGKAFGMSGYINTVPVPAALFFVAPALAGVFGWSRRKINA